MKRSTPASLLLATAFSAVCLAQTQASRSEFPSQNKTIRIQKVANPPKLDEFLGGGEVAGYFRITDFRQNRPADGKPASRETIAWVAYDQKNLYAVFLCREKAGGVRARMAKREDIFSDDMVALYLDPFHDKQRSFSFYVNPFGIQADSVYSEDQAEDDYSYDAIWRSEGHLTPDGYAVLMAIPFRSLRFPNTPIQTWGFGVARFIRAVNEASYWPYYTSRIEGFTQQLGTLEGLENISPGRNLQFIPYGAFASSHYLNAPDYSPLPSPPPVFDQKNKFRAGLDSKIILHDSLTFDLTLNPDFSQVETDDPQVTVDQRFEVFFPEKRPFFLDNASYFQTSENLFFSRRIADPEYGGRLTGKAGPWLLGFLGIDDRAPGQEVSPADPASGDHAVIGVARVQREFANQSTVGALFTNYSFAGRSEQVLSIDARIKLTPHLVLRGQAARSQAHNPDGTRPQGAIYHVDLLYSSLHLTGQATFRDLSPDFQSTLGYIPRVNIRQGMQNLAWKWLPSGPILKSIGPALNTTEDWDHKGNLQDRIVSAGVQAELTGNTFITAARTEAIEVYQNLNFRKHSNDFSFSSELLKTVGVEASYGMGAGVNYDPATGVPPFLGAAKNLNLKFTIRPSKKIKMDEIYIFSHLSTLKNSMVAEQYGGGAVFTNHLVRSQLNCQFTRELSFRAILDYNGVLPNVSLVDFDRYKRVTGDLLLTYLINPGTAFYLGYTNTHENLAIFPGIPNYLGTIGGPSTTTGRQIFVKLSYLFRY